MTDDTPQTGGRSAADKERSRQQSRQVNAKAAAKSTANRSTKQPAKGGRPGGDGRQGAQTPSGQGRSGGKQAAAKPAPKKGASAGAAQPRAGGRPVGGAGLRRSPTTLLTWGVVALVLIIVVVLVVVKVTGGSSGNSGNGPPSQPVPASIVQQVTAIPPSVYNQVGVNSPTAQVAPPTVIHGQPPLVLNGKPGAFYLGGEFCPYCAAERWAMVAAFSRFGKFTNLQTMQSASADVFPETQTFTFHGASFSSPYMTFDAKEHKSNQLNSAQTDYTILEPLSKSETALLNKYQSPTFLGAGSDPQAIPFMDIGNKVLVSGASYSPAILQGLTRAQIAGDLSDPKSPVTQAIVATANYLSASVCASDGQQPASVCTSSGVSAAAKALKLSS